MKRFSLINLTSQYQNSLKEKILQTKRPYFVFSNNSPLHKDVSGEPAISLYKKTNLLSNERKKSVATITTGRAPPLPETPQIPVSPSPSFYKRPLPSHLIPFSSTEGKKLFREAIETGEMESYWTLAEQFHTQSEPAYCGLATLTMVLNALQIDPNRLWKGPWRWYSEDLLDCCTPLEIVKKEGITLSDFACLAKCNGAEIEIVRSENTSEEEFRSRIRETCASEGAYLVVSFSRAILGQTGDGHFSAISGYHKEKDMALVMDTAKFKYPAFWCPVSLLYEAMKPKDKTSGLSRGYIVLKKASATQSCGNSSCKSEKCQSSNSSTVADESSPSSSAPLIATTKSEEETNYSWTMLSHYLSHRLPMILRETKPQTVHDVIHDALKYLPKEALPLIDSILHPQSDSKEKLLKDIQTTPIYQVTKETLNIATPITEELKSFTPEVATMVMISCPSQLYKELSAELRSSLKELRDIDSLPVELSKEVIEMRYKMLNFARQCGCKVGIHS